MTYKDMVRHKNILIYIHEHFDLDKFDPIYNQLIKEPESGIRKDAGAQKGAIEKAKQTTGNAQLRILGS